MAAHGNELTSQLAAPTRSKVPPQTPLSPEIARHYLYLLMAASGCYRINFPALTLIYYRPYSSSPSFRWRRATHPTRVSRLLRKLFSTSCFSKFGDSHTRRLRHWRWCLQHAAHATNLTAEHTAPDCTHAYPVAARQCQYKNRRQCAQAHAPTSHQIFKILAKEISKDSLTPFALSNHTLKDGNTIRPI